jgi:uncharacterized protein YjiS (DUF1127 family)
MLWISRLGYAASASVLATFPLPGVLRPPEAKPDVGLRQLKVLIAEWRRRVRERRELSTLDERDRHDLRISGCDAQREAQKPFWQA